MNLLQIVKLETVFLNFQKAKIQKKKLEIILELLF